MSIGKRAYNLLRAYVGQEWERIEGVFEEDARTELNDYLSNKTKPPPPPTNPIPEVAAQQTPSSEATKIDETAAYHVLNLPRDASLADLQRRYKRLSERSLPANFPEGSEERKKSAQVHLCVQEAYDCLLPKLDVRLKRFQNLDLD